MKSCRNCAKSIASGSFQIALVCTFDGVQVAPPPSMNAEENQKVDERLRICASKCVEYAAE
jgi:hypothetical protein